MPGVVALPVPANVGQRPRTRTTAELLAVVVVVADVLVLVLAGGEDDAAVVDAVIVAVEGLAGGGLLGTVDEPVEGGLPPGTSAQLAHLPFGRRKPGPPRSPHSASAVSTVRAKPRGRSKVKKMRQELLSFMA